MQITRAVRPKGAPQKYHVYVDPGDGLVHAQNNRTGVTDHTGSTSDVVLAALLADLGSTVATATLSDETHNLAADTTIPANVGIQAVQGTLLKPASGKTLTLDGTLDAGPYQIFDLSAGGSVTLSAGAARRIYPEWVGAKADNSTDNATPFANWKALVPARGGRGELQQGVYKTSGTLLVPSYTHIDGVPGSIEIDGTGDPLSGSCLLWVGAANGTVLSFFDTLLAGARGVNINGGGIAGVTGVLFDADNNPISKLPSLEGFGIYNCGVPGTSGVGVQIGRNAVTNTQADTWTLRRGIIKNCDTGVDIRSLNAGYQGIVQQVNVIGHRYGVRLVSTGNNEINNVPFGGHTTYTVADIFESSDGAGHGGSGAQTLVVNCQTEKNANGTTCFLLVDASCSPNLTQPYTLLHNRITNCGILLKQTRLLHLKGGNEFWEANVVVAGGNPVITDDGSTFDGRGLRTVTDLVTTAGSNIVTSATAAFVSPTGTYPSYSDLGDLNKRATAPNAGPGGAAIAGFPQVAIIGTVLSPTQVALVDGNGNPVNATASATGVSARFDYGYVIPPNTGELSFDSVDAETDTLRREIVSRSNAGVVKVVGANPAAANIGYEVDGRAMGGGRYLLVAGGTDHPGYFHIIDAVTGARLASFKSGINNGQFAVDAWGVTVVGGYAQSIGTIHTSAYGVLSTDGIVRVDPTGGAFTVTLFTAVQAPPGRRFTFLNVGPSTNVVTIQAQSGDNIKGASSIALSGAYAFLTLASDGVHTWYVVG